jgi:hypothetical protein
VWVHFKSNRMREASHIQNASCVEKLLGAWNIRDLIVEVFEPKTILFQEYQESSLVTKRPEMAVNHRGLGRSWTAPVPVEFVRLSKGAGELKRAGVTIGRAARASALIQSSMKDTSESDVSGNDGGIGPKPAGSSATSTMRPAGSNPSQIPPDRKCHLCLRNETLPMCPERTLIAWLAMQW